MSNALLFAQGIAAAGIVQLIIIVIVIAGVIGIAMIVARQAGIAIPPFIIQIAWIILACVVGVIAIRYLVAIL